MNTIMHSHIMERGRQKKLKSLTEDSLGTELISTGRFCFSCEQIFASRKCVEEHMCSAASFICSCGTEFTEYKDMLEHSTTHEPGHQVLDHQTIKKRRIEKRIEEEEQLKRLETGEVVWKAPKLDNVASISLPMKAGLQASFTSAHMPQIAMQSSQISQVPELYPSVSQAYFLPNPVSSPKDMNNIFANVGTPTVDLWTLYQPVVLIQTVRSFSKKKPYACGKCGQCFMTKTSLVYHHSSHVTDKVSGCIGCGLLLSSKKLVPRFHVCNSPCPATKFRLITARPLKSKKLNPAGTDWSRNLSAGWPQGASSLQVKSQTLSMANTGGQTPRATSTLQLKSQNIRPYNQNNQGLHVTASFKGQSARAFAPFSPLSAKRLSLNPSASSKISHRLPVTPSRQWKVSTNSASGVSSKLMAASTASKGFMCKVCHLPFETAQLLQRHKCIKAQEFMAQHVRAGKHYKLKRVTPSASPNPLHMNGDRKFVVAASGNIKKTQVMAVGLDRGQGEVPVNGKTEVEIDDDCYVVESGPDKPAEMIYQVTSSVPIKT
ncbi:uncharacterized protein LOC104938179 [Larimichthys crocea]|uniref:uncharacterized protein LOC104938179 n=1 Tax=Larimichthys crocea TaxID=215358 RepID=UPI000900FE4B|nr:uncharacterized protein LOC104938179 [Larimichthys crocea]